MVSEGDGLNEDYERIREMLLEWKIDKIAAQGEAVIPNLIAALKDEDGLVRGNASGALRELAEKHPEYDWKEAGRALIAALKDDETGVREDAAGALGKIAEANPGDAEIIEAVPALIVALNDESNEVGENAAEALRKIGVSAIPALSEALKDANGLTRGNAALMLGEIGDASAVPVLIETLKDRDEFVRANAVFALGKIGDASAVPALIEALKDRDMRYEAVEALGKIAEKTEIDLEKVKTTLKESVEPVRKEGDPVKLRNAEVEAAKHLILISNAAAKFRARRCGEDGMILVGEIPKPPSGKMYRATRKTKAMA